MPPGHMLESFWKKRMLIKKNALIRLVCGQICAEYSWLMIVVAKSSLQQERHKHLWVEPFELCEKAC